MSRIYSRFLMALLEGIFVGLSIGETARNLKNTQWGCLQVRGGLFFLNMPPVRLGPRVNLMLY